MITVFHIWMGMITNNYIWWGRLKKLKIDQSLAVPKGPLYGPEVTKEVFHMNYKISHKWRIFFFYV